MNSPLLLSGWKMEYVYGIRKKRVPSQPSLWNALSAALRTVQLITHALVITCAWKTLLRRLGWLVLALCIMWAVLSKTLLLLQSTCWPDFGQKVPQNRIWGARKWGLVPQGVNMTWNECHPVVGSKSKHTSFVLTVCQWQNPFNI